MQFFSKSPPNHTVKSYPNCTIFPPQNGSHFTTLSHNFSATQLTFFHVLATSFLSQSTTSSSTSAINLSVSNIVTGQETGPNYWMKENEFRNFEFRKNRGHNFQCLAPHKSLRHVMASNARCAHTHILYTRTPYNCADSDFCHNMLGQDVGRSRFKFLSRRNRTKKCII